jgi:ATPase subunit of ABC transporter with duplicated ATPase domains
MGYLPQEGLWLSGRSVFAECMTVFSDLRALEDEQEQLARRMAELAVFRHFFHGGRLGVNYQVGKPKWNFRNTASKL